MPFQNDGYLPQLTPSWRPLLVWSIAAAGSLLVVLMILSAPIAAATNHNLLAFTIYRTFSSICHQLPERSFFIAGHKFAVCARCTGLYAGFTLAVLLYPAVRPLATTIAPPRKWLFLAAMPLAVDFSLGFFGIWENTHSSRLLSGLLLGAASVLYVMPGLAELSLRRWRLSAPAPQPGATRPLFPSEVTATAHSDYSAPHRRI